MGKSVMGRCHKLFLTVFLSLCSLGFFGGEGGVVLALERTSSTSGFNWGDDLSQTSISVSGGVNGTYDTAPPVKMKSTHISDIKTAIEMAASVCGNVPQNVLYPSQDTQTLSMMGYPSKPLPANHINILRRAIEALYTAKGNPNISNYFTGSVAQGERIQKAHIHQMRRALDDLVVSCGGAGAASCMLGPIVQNHDLLVDCQITIGQLLSQNYVMCQAGWGTGTVVPGIQGCIAQNCQANGDWQERYCNGATAPIACYEREEGIVAGIIPPNQYVCDTQAVAYPASGGGCPDAEGGPCSISNRPCMKIYVGDPNEDFCGGLTPSCYADGYNWPGTGACNAGDPSGVLPNALCCSGRAFTRCMFGEYPEYTCANSGSLAVCGNGATEGAEQCDDSNTSDGDGCSSACQTETCIPDEQWCGIQGQEAACLANCCSGAFELRGELSQGPGGTLPTEFWLSCVSSGFSATCSDGIQNQGETGVDCGGPCAACACLPAGTQCSDFNVAVGALYNFCSECCDTGSPLTCNSGGEFTQCYCGGGGGGSGGGGGPVLYCGDLVCNNGEDCSTCAGDCGPCGCGG